MTTLEAQNEVITNLILENQKIKQERDKARKEWGKASMDAAQLLSEKTKVMAERDEALKELEEYRSIAENIGATKAISEKEKAIRERDKAREKYATEATEHMLSVNKLCNERDDLRDALMAIEDRCVDCEDACDDIQKIRDIARAALEK